MRPVNLLIKPASGSCNMRCRYCFYADETENREISSYGMMSLETLEVMVKKALEQADSCAFLFQGGEPTLAGLDFYRTLVELEQRYNTRQVPVQRAIQTNGLLIDKEWAQFLAEHHFLVGLSMDGTQAVHDRWRVDARGGTFQRVKNAASLLEEAGAEFNILTVVTAQTARQIESIYDFYKKNGFRYQQYIPCLDPLGEKRGGHEYSLTPTLYGKFLKKLFDRWYGDLLCGDFVYNRYFENLVGMLRGYPPESCGLSGHCARQVVVEADGSVYPCDFYAMDEYLLGNITTNSLEELEQKRDEIGFLQASCQVDPACRTCQWAQLCRGGCRRDREPLQNGRLSLNYFCPAYQDFFAYASPRLTELARNGVPQPNAGPKNNG